MKRVSLLQIFKTFFMLGLATFGGGLAMLPFIKKQVLDHQWIQEKDWEQFLAVIPITPGALAVNMSHLIGNKVRGWVGGLVAVLAMVLPSVLVISLFAFALQDWLNDPIFLSVMQGVYLVVIAFLIKAFIDFARTSYRQPIAWLYGGIAAYLLVMTWLSPTNLLLVALGIALLEFLMRKNK